MRCQLRCACRGVQQQPFAGTETTTVKAARVLTLVNPITMHTHFAACVKPVSEDEKWVNSQIEIAARDIKTEADLEAWYDRSLLDIAQLLEREALPANEVFRRIPYDSSKHTYTVDETTWDT